MSSAAGGRTHASTPSMRSHQSEATRLEEFRALYVEFARSMLNVTNQRYVDAGREKVLVQEIQFSDGNYTAVTRQASAQERFLPAANESAFPRATAKKCAELFFSLGLASGIKLSNSAGDRIKNPPFEEIEPFISHMRLEKPVRHLIAKHGRTSFSTRQILACLNRYIEYWKGAAATDPGYAPIFNFDTDVQTIKLDEIVSIVRFTDVMKDQLMKALGPLERHMHIRNYAGASHMARLRPVDGLRDDDAKRQIRVHARQALQCAITSLRIMKTERVGTLGYIQVPDLTLEVGTSLGLADELDLPWHPMTVNFWDPFMLERADLPRFRRLYKMLSGNQFHTWDKLELLLRQFNRSCQRERREDRILDYAICLESTLLSGVETELSYRLALLTAKLLRDRRDPEQTYRHVRCLYGVRSKIVHSNLSLGSQKIEASIKGAGLEPNEFMGSTEALMRDLVSALVQRVSRGRELKNIRDELNEAIVNSL